MKRKLSVALFFLFFACKKEYKYTPDAGNLNNKLTADVLVKGVKSHGESIGNASIFSRTIFSPGDTLIAIVGGTDSGQINITLENVTVAGRYVFGQPLDSGRYVAIEYIEGNIIFGPATYYFQTDGEVIINILTEKHVEGTFKATCMNNGLVAKITNGSFSGDFQ
jgi:hypothetical protein